MNQYEVLNIRIYIFFQRRFIQTISLMSSSLKIVSHNIKINFQFHGNLINYKHCYYTIKMKYI